LKEMARRHLPETIIERRKAGFAVPVSSWLRRGGALGSYVDLLVEPGSKSRDYFEKTRLQRIIDDHRDGARDHGEILWALVNLELWMRIMAEALSTKRTGRPNGVSIPASV